MVTRTRLASGVFLLMDDVCLARVERIEPGIILSTFVGYESTDVVEEVFEALEQELALHERIVVYFDALVLGRISRKTKDLAITWGKAHRGRVDGNVLIASSIAEIVFRIVSLAVAMPIRIYSNPVPFLASIRSHVPTFHMLPILDVKLLFQGALEEEGRARTVGECKAPLG